MKKVINTARTVFRLTVISSAVYTDFLKGSEENPRPAFPRRLTLGFDFFALRLWGPSVLSALSHQLIPEMGP